jgi:hypothetical protein
MLSVEDDTIMAVKGRRCGKGKMIVDAIDSVVTEELKLEPQRPTPSS